MRPFYWRYRKLEQRSGFTLIEAFAMVAGVAILILVLFPVFSRPRETRCGTTCHSNLKQIGLGIMQYAQDNDENYPRTINGFTTIDDQKYALSWRSVIYPYTKSIQLLMCPNNPTSKVRGVDALPPRITHTSGLPSAYDVVDAGPIRPSATIWIGEVDHTARTILVFDKNGDNAQAKQVGVLWDNDSGEGGWTHIIFAGHFGHTNFLFADGHVKGMKPTATVANGVNMWHLDNRAPVTRRVWEKLLTAEADFPS